MKLRIDALLLLVAAAGYVATSGIHVDVGRFALLIVAGFLGAAGASATNHYLDRDLDSVMRRTQARPLPQHRIEPPAHALEFGLGLVALGLVVAGLGINLLTALMIGLGFVVYIGVYTLGLKRTHVSNIVIGGFAGSFPALQDPPPHRMPSAFRPSSSPSSYSSGPRAISGLSRSGAARTTGGRDSRCFPRSLTNERP